MHILISEYCCLSNAVVCQMRLISGHFLSEREPAADAFSIATPHINARPSRERIVPGSILFYVN